MFTAIKNLLSNISYSRNFDVSHLYPHFYFSLTFFTIFTIGPSQTFCPIATIHSAVLDNPEFFLTKQASKTRGGLG